jgi:quercetin dioxygenase-like cupin family protein
MISQGQENSRMTVPLVRFAPEPAPTGRHAVGQAVHVTEGVGPAGTRDGTVLRVRAGDTVSCPPGEDHWHGAAADTFMSRPAMLESRPGGGRPTTAVRFPSPASFKAAGTALVRLSGAPLDGLPRRPAV